MEALRQGIVLPSADFGYPIYSVFDEAAYEPYQPGFETAQFEPEGPLLPATRLDAITALEFLARGLESITSRDAKTILWPGKPYSSPRTRERWIELLDMSLADLARLRTYFEQETPEQVTDC